MTVTTLVGLVLATAVTVLDKITEEYTHHRRWLRDLWFVLVLAGLATSVYGAYRAAQQAKIHAQNAATEENRRDKAIGILTSSAQSGSVSFQQIEDDLTQVMDHFGIRQSATAQAATAQPQYLVEIAADTSRERLEPYLKNLQSRFGDESGAGILPPKPGSKWYLLVWGQHLSRAAAEQRKKAADALHLPPNGASATVEPQY